MACAAPLWMGLELAIIVVNKLSASTGDTANDLEFNPFLTEIMARVVCICDNFTTYQSCKYFLKECCELGSNQQVFRRADFVVHQPES